MIKNGKDLKKYRHSLKLSQREFGEMFGIKRSTLSCWEIGTRKISADFLIELNDSVELYESWRYIHQKSYLVRLIDWIKKTWKKFA